MFLHVDENSFNEDFMSNVFEMFNEAEMFNDSISDVVTDDTTRKDAIPRHKVVVEVKNESEERILNLVKLRKQ